jgi:hypothetical protein
MQKKKICVDGDGDDVHDDAKRCHEARAKNKEEQHLHVRGMTTATQFALAPSLV